MARHIASLALALTLTACATEPSGPPTAAEPPASGAEGAVPDTAMVRDVTLGGTADLVRSDPTRVSPSVAIQTIDQWIARLDTAAVEGGPEIRDGLTTLRNLLQSSPLDGHAIGETMRDLGGRTAEAAGGNAEVRALAAALRAAGGRLAPEPAAPDSMGGEGT